MMGGKDKIRSGRVPGFRVWSVQSLSFDPLREGSMGMQYYELAYRYNLCLMGSHPDEIIRREMDALNLAASLLSNCSIVKVCCNEKK